MNLLPLPCFPRRWLAASLLLLVAGLGGTEPAPPSGQGIFAPTDDAETAFQKITSYHGTPDLTDPAELATPAGRQAQIRRHWIQGLEFLQVRLACLDFYAQFPNSPRYKDLRSWEASQLVVTGEMLQLKLRMGTQLTMTDGEKDALLAEDDRVMFALYRAESRARFIVEIQGLPLPEARLAAFADVVTAHPGNRQARQALMMACLDVPEDEGIRALRRLLPNDPEAAAFASLVGSIGQACELEFAALDGRRVRLADYRGKVVLLEFWARWCAPCVHSLPALKRYSEDRTNAGFAVIGVNLDEARADVETVIREHAIGWPQHFDGKGWNNEVARRFFVTSIPRGVLIDRNGRLRSLNCDFRRPEGRRLIESLLAEASPVESRQP